MAETSNFKIIYQGALWPGSTSRMRSLAFASLDGVTSIGLDTGAHLGRKSGLWNRVLWRLGRPADVNGENDALLAAVEREKPDAVLIDSSRVITRRTLKRIRELGPIVRAFYSPDDSVGRHFLSLQLRESLPEWDVFFTNKRVNVAELKQLGAKNPVHMGKGCDPNLHRPLAEQEVGDEFEAFDLVFVGTYEAERCASLNRLVEAGLTVVVYGDSWREDRLDPRIALRTSRFGEDYVRAMHTGKVALGFLRKLNRDTITSRTWETTAMGRPLLAEKTVDHDLHFADGVEYVGFTDDDDLVAKARQLITDSAFRRRLGERGHERCLASGASTAERAKEMLGHIIAARNAASCPLTTKAQNRA